MSEILIVIPARYASSRLPGKPLVKIKGKEMIRRVAGIAEHICSKYKEASYVIATDDERISKFCTENNLKWIMTSQECRNGTERCLEAVKNIEAAPNLIINLQGDNPLCPPWIVESIIEEWKEFRADVYTPYVKLDWKEYDKLCESKNTPETRYSGTTVLIDKNGYAMAFSKNTIPAIRKPEKAREYPLSPVCRHIGLYAYTYETLKTYGSLEESPYEKSYIEGLEQMRFLYNGLKVKMVAADYRGRETTSGVDSPPDILRVEEILEKYGEFDL
ncbi:MAG: 3-deoxy-manno-octulosonate cytidylyltransferase [Rikenellaceae bacterium]|nr:3-deoxy-manno-octulosonate cytidylyltransferase [Rikenellaceae bacterium]